jgi:hypothetical protein
MSNLNEYVDDTDNFTGDIGIVFKSDDLNTVKKVLGSLIPEEDCFLVCHTKTYAGNRLFYRIINSENNRNILEKSKNDETHQSFRISASKIAKVKELEERYKQIFQKMTSIGDITDVAPMYEKLCNDCENIVLELVIARG